MYYYIAVNDAGKSALLAGPYETEPDNALRRMVVDMACDVNRWAWFYTFSLASSSLAMKTRFGVVKICTNKLMDNPPLPCQLR